MRGFHPSASISFFLGLPRPLAARAKISAGTAPAAAIQACSCTMMILPDSGA